MSIPDDQLETWAHQGSVTQSAATYNTIRGVLDDSRSPYYPKSYSIFLQGSYGNNTNVYRDSDVDTVIRLNDTYYYDNGALGEGQKGNFDRAFSAAQYGFDEFKADVLSWLRTNYGAAVTSGSKAITITGSGARRDADVLVCTKYRRYRSDSTGNDDRYEDGICFFRTDGTRIENFPKQHSDNCTSKHQNTSSRFKPIVRVWKNLRNRMVDEGVIRDGLAPSYFIEGMLWNIPDGNFEASHGATFVNCARWLQQADKTQLACASNLHWLLRDNVPLCWNEADFNAFLAAVVDYWNGW